MRNESIASGFAGTLFAKLKIAFLISEKPGMLVLNNIRNKNGFNDQQLFSKTTNLIRKLLPDFLL
jgi:hypothetical protein